MRDTPDTDGEHHDNGKTLYATYHERKVQAQQCQPLNAVRSKSFKKPPLTPNSALDLVAER